MREPSICTRPFQLNTLEHELLRDSIEKNGLLCPIVVAGDPPTIVDGYRRWLTLRALGWTDIPTVTVEGDPRTLRVIAQSNSLSDTEKATILARNLSESPDSTAAELGHLYHWPPLDVERLVGRDYLSPRARSLYDDGQIPLAAVWHLGKLSHEEQDGLLESGEDLLSEAAAAARVARAARRTKIVSRPRGKSIQAVLRELETPTVAGPQLIAARAETPLDGWMAALRWVAGKSS